jgi:hypothetical protein
VLALSVLQKMQSLTSGSMFRRGVATYLREIKRLSRVGQEG